MMKKIVLLLLSALVVAPAWAEEEKAPAPSAKPAEMQAASADAQTAETRAAPVAQTGVVIELKGAAKDTAALSANLEKDAVFKDAGCSTKSARKSAKITCAKADSGLMAFLAKNAPANIRWSISAAPITMKALALPTTATACYRLICSGVAGCFTKGCFSTCTGC